MKNIFWAMVGCFYSLFCVLCFALNLPPKTARDIGRKLCEP